MNNTRKIVFLALLSSLGSIIGLFETLIPLPFLAPGMRLGFSNIVVLVSLVVFGYNEGLSVALLKSLILMLLSGNVSGFIYSFSGAFTSALAMIIALTLLKDKISLIGVSLIGSSVHNTTQVLVSSLILKNIMIFSYLPILLLIGIFTGIFVGMSSIYISKNLGNRVTIKNKGWTN